MGVMLILFALHYVAYAPAPRLMAFSESQSWYDEGLKVVVFDDQSGYVFRYVTPIVDSGVQDAKIVAFHLTDAQYASLIRSYRNSLFLLQPRALDGNVTDGTEFRWFFAAGSVYRKARNYQVFNPFTSHLTSTFLTLMQPIFEQGEPIAFSTFLEDLRRRNADPNPSPTTHRALRDVSDHLLRKLSSTRLFTYADVSDLILENPDY